MLEWIRYALWKKMARKAIEAKKIAQCVLCDDPIVPGDFVGICTVGDALEERLVHAGYHFTLNDRDAICETGAIGCGVWDGEKVIGTGESLAEKALRTGKVQISG